MGPQLDSCGRTVRAAVAATALGRLQWGRNLTVAEGAKAKRKADIEAALQWGRNLTVAEGVDYLINQDNARPLQWGRNLTVAEGGCTCKHPEKKTLLQWGRNLTVAEGAAAIRRLPRAEQASMGPQLDSCGRGPRARRGPGLWARFNGAAT